MTLDELLKQPEYAGLSDKEALTLAKTLDVVPPNVDTARMKEADRITNAWTVTSNAFANGEINTFAEAVAMFGGQ